MQYYMSVSEIQDRMKALLSCYTKNRHLKSPFVNQRLLDQLERMKDPNLLNNDAVAEEIITVFLNSLVLAGHLGIDIEGKIYEYLCQLERDTLFVM
ncbi:MAG: hypothetical protein ACFFE8_15485 [Candidatus Heimdallarchaeota archaeon]